MKLFIDTTSDWLLLIILNSSNRVVYSQKLNHARAHTDLTIPTIQTALKKVDKKLADVQAVYLLDGPGLYTGIRVAVTFAKTLALINSQVCLYKLNSLLFQAGRDNAVVMRVADRTNFYLAVYEAGEELIPPQLIPQDIWKEVVSLFLSKNFVVRDNYDFNFVQHFQSLQDCFVKVQDPDRLEPFYIKTAL